MRLQLFRYPKHLPRPARLDDHEGAPSRRGLDVHANAPMGFDMPKGHMPWLRRSSAEPLEGAVVLLGEVCTRPLGPRTHHEGAWAAGNRRQGRDGARNRCRNVRCAANEDRREYQ